MTWTDTFNSNAAARRLTSSMNNIKLDSRVSKAEIDAMLRKNGIIKDNKNIVNTPNNAQQQNYQNNTQLNPQGVNNVPQYQAYQVQQPSYSNYQPVSYQYQPQAQVYQYQPQIQTSQTIQPQVQTYQYQPQAASANQVQTQIPQYQNYQQTASYTQPVVQAVNTNVAPTNAVNSYAALNAKPQATGQNLNVTTQNQVQQNKTQ